MHFSLPESQYELRSCARPPFRHLQTKNPCVYSSLPIHRLSSFASHYSANTMTITVQYSANMMPSQWQYSAITVAIHTVPVQWQYSANVSAQCQYDANTACLTFFLAAQGFQLDHVSLHTRLVGCMHRTLACCVCCKVRLRVQAL